MKKMLIVDDEVGIVDEVKDFLIEEGFLVNSADTGKEGIDRLHEFQPDIMLLDIKLPDMSGLDVLKIAKEKYAHIKVIVATGYVDQKLIDQAERLGRDAFLQKPFNLEHLRDEIERLLS